MINTTLSKNRHRHWLNGHATVNDRGVLNALRALSLEKVLGLFEESTEAQKNLLNQL